MERVALTTGRLDGLEITPVEQEGEIKFLTFTVHTLPGLRIVIEADAARELQTALATVLGSE